MKIIIQCAGRKHNGGYWQTKDGELVAFVANPTANVPVFHGIYASPDDDIPDQNTTWRKQVLDYNILHEHKKNNPFDIYPAYCLYENRVYQELVKKFGLDSVYILSAGWGLIRSSFLTPKYDITFQSKAEDFQRRRKSDRYNDFCMLPENTKETVIFLGGKDYVPLFCSLTTHIQSKKVVFYNSSIHPNALGCCLKHYDTNIRTNWHYACALEIINGSLRMDECC
ncbi:MAG: hypothetical protein ACLQJ7_14095 [Syntrophobacteraceae bacterium]